MRGSFHGLCTSREPLTHPASLRSTGRPLPARAGRGDPKRFALGCLNTESIHVIPAKRALANNLQQSWRFDWEPPKAVLRDVWTIDWILDC
jgi:hypothetical protein